MSESFWNMGGYAFYVWGSYGAALAVFIWNLLLPRLRRRDVLQMLREQDGMPRGEQ